MNAGRLVELPAAERRRALVGAAVRFGVTFIGVIAVYYLLPLSQGVVGPQDVIELGIAAVLFVALVWWQVRQILRSDLPVLRALEGVAVVIPFFFCTYAAAYVILSQADPGNFSETLTPTDALYFSIVIFGTVGFGDIVPVTDLARLVVSSQVLLNLIFIALVLRGFVAVSKITLRREIRPND